MVKHVLPFRVSATLVIALQRRVRQLLNLKVLGSVLGKLPSVSRHASLLAISYYVLGQARRILCQGDLLLRSAVTAFGKSNAGFTQCTFALERLLVRGVEVLVLIYWLAGNHRHMRIVIVAEVAIVLGLVCRQLAISIAFEKLAVNVGH